MKKGDKDKETIIKLYEDSLNDIIWTHKIQSTLLDKLHKNYKIYSIIKETILGLSGFVSVIFLYLEKYTGAIITSGVSTLSILVENIYKLNNYEQRINDTKSIVNDLWFMKKELIYSKEYLKNGLINCEEARDKLEEQLRRRKEIYLKLEPTSQKIINDASYKLKERKDEEINKEFFKEGE